MKASAFLMSFCLLICSTVYASENAVKTLKFTPVEHASFIIESAPATLFVDPVGHIEQFKTSGDAQIILITDIHGDHLKKEVVDALKTAKTRVIAPQAVVDKLGYGEILKNGEKVKVGEIVIEAIPMYNLTDERLKFHEKGRGNGYVLTIEGKRIYISGDTEDIPEMRKLTGIDYAFICMNLPYTMTVEQAASAVLEMKPLVVYPYHYRGTDGLSDVERFKTIVSSNPDIEVRQLNWYQ